ncbi:PrGVORF115 [Pieris rapae granulovirus Wuhan]|uniref:PrGVORF115 n=1 Tax=Pieris rapae granulovirus Wuhan TaxID=2848030 RepID=D2J4T2_9BBAC|nr:PrGVORF115 [Betabaculovirus arrapae]ACZ63601.1 PrGVORF115 [Betabaculovirus arrapae]ADO85543.1 unknown [Pieris rapae granulovirus]AGS18869.1 hypothetical protein [Pieris rapae granulovirus]UOS85789.1 ORF115 [Pieris rapae granulovirus]
MSLMSSIKLPELHKIIFISDVDVALSDQYIFIEEIDGLFAYKNKINNNLTYFSKKLVNLHNTENNYLIYY